MAHSQGLKFNLLEILKQLDASEFSRFKTFLRAYPLPRGLRFPHLQTELSNPEQILGMLSHCPRDWVGMVTIHILEKLNRSDLVKRVKDELRNATLRRLFGRPPLSLRVAWVTEPCQYRPLCQQEETPGEEERYKGVLEERLHNLWKDNFWPGNSENIHVVTEGYKALLPLCNPKKTERPSGHTLVLHGPAGFGKTTLAKKLMLEWMEGTQGQVFQCVFYLRCRELNHMSPCTFMELISKGHPELEDDIQKILEKMKEVLFVVDGFEELRVPAGVLIHDICGDWKKQKPVPILLSSLLKRKMVPKAKLLVTTRPQALQELFILVDQPLLLEVEGFSEQDRHAYFLKHFGDEKRALRALEAVKGNAALFRMGSAPAVCWVACACLELQMQREADLAVTCRTCTSLFLQFLCSQVPSSDFPREQLRTSLEAICLLAAQGLWTQLPIFCVGDLWNLGLKESDLHPFVEKCIVQKDGNCFFIHLSIQQLLAAIFYILKRKKKEDGDRPKRDIGDVRRLFSREERVKNPNLVQVGLFLSGLLNEKLVQELEMTFGCQTSMEVKQELLQYRSENNKPFFSLMDLREVFACLYESQEEELVREIMGPFEELTLHLKTSTDLMYSSFCLKSCPGLHRLSIRVTKGVFLENDMTMEPKARDDRPQNDQRLLSLWTDLCSVFESSKKLIFLDISQSFFSSSSLQILCAKLTSAPCHLQKVVLRNISPADAFQNLCLAFSGCESLTHLTLQDSNNQNCVLPSLCEVLKHPKCNLQKVRLGSCSATAQQWDYFFLTLQVNQSLVCLGLEDSKLMDEGAKKLCITLRGPQCSLQRLLLENCHLTEAFCKELSYTLMASQTLTHLSLAKNSLGDGGVRDLCEGLCHPECKLQTLVLQGCSITAVSCRDLSVALRCNQTLTTLDLSQNCLGFDGIKTLCEGLRDETSSPQILRLKISDVNAQIQKFLEEVEKSNPRLAIRGDHGDSKSKSLSSHDFFF